MFPFREKVVPLHYKYLKYIWLALSVITYQEI
jgi:hypothetical protein